MTGSRSGCAVDAKSILDTDGNENSSTFVHKKMLTYMDRLLEGNLELGREAFEFLHFCLNHDLAAELLNSIMKLLPPTKLPESQPTYTMVDESWSFATLCGDTMKLLNPPQKRQVKVLVRNQLAIRLHELDYKGSTTIEANIHEFRKMFLLNDIETELCVFLFILSNWNQMESLFQNHLQCNRYQGRVWLTTILDCKECQLAKALSGKLEQIGILETDNYRGGFELKHSFGQKLQNLSPPDFQNQFIKQIRCDPVPLDDHMIEPRITSSLLNLLSYKAKSSTHILLYGPPGTGKTSYAYGLAQKLGLNCYQVEYGSNDRNVSNRAAITACVNLASETEGALFVADDSDVILNTRNSWYFFGQSPDKSWLHDLLETPGVRMIWIVNSVQNIEESVARRFSMSVQFRPFNKKQLVRLWNRIIKKHKFKRFFTDNEIEELACRFTVSAGVIDLSIRKAAESQNCSKKVFKQMVILALESSCNLVHTDKLPLILTSNHRNFSLEGLNLFGTNAESLLKELKAFEELSGRKKSHESISMSLLFFGPSGSGKSALARYIATHLEKEIVFKRVSDLFSKWIGETEQNIRRAYEEAHSKDAVLVFDEADSLIFNRDRAEHSWEISFTNEFLTWMESFNGIQIFTTNRLKDLDSASLRRFNHKIEFGYLKPEGNLIFYRSFLAPLTRRTLDTAMEESVRKIEGLTPGDFKSVKDKFRFMNRKHLNHESLISALADESRIKSIHAGQSRIGF